MSNKKTPKYLEKEKKNTEQPEVVFVADEEVIGTYSRPKVKVVNTRFVNVRERPDKKSPVVFLVGPDTVFFLNDDLKSDWASITEVASTSRTGFMMTEFLERVSDG